MDRLIRNIFRILPVISYLLILLISFFLIYRKKNYRNTIKNNYKYIIINTLIVLIIASIGFYIFFSLEDFVYDYDYAGHWIKSLRLRQMFFEEPHNLLKFVNDSLNNDVYSYLSAYLSLPITIINNSFGFHCYGTFLFYIVPTFIIFQILYFTYFDKHKYLPILILLTFSIVYISIFDGETEVSGLLPLLMTYVLSIFIDFDDIDYIDNIFINLYAFLCIFIRRFYLYAIVVYYICYFIKYLKHYNFKVFNNEGLKSFIKILSSGLILLMVVLIIYNNFFMRAIYSNYGEDYAFNDHSGKLAYFFYSISPLISFISIYGIYEHYKKHKDITMIIILILSIFLPAILFWRVQSFELHHFYISLIGIIIFYTYGLYNIYSYKNKILPIIISLLLLIQSVSVFISNKNIPFTLSFTRTPKVLENKKEYEDFMKHLISISGTGEESRSIYFATGDAAINMDRIKNSILPNLSSPNILHNVFDIRDGFPVYIKYVNYVIVSEPQLYLRKDYQHFYDVITNAIENENVISELYELKDTLFINDIKFKIYERKKEYTSQVKQYFYDEAYKLYPDRIDLYKDILD